MTSFELTETRENYHKSATVDIPPLPRISLQGFCLTESFMDALETAAKDRRMARVKMRVQAGGVKAAIEAFREAATPNLILVEFRMDEVSELPFALDQLAQHCDPETRVVLIGPVNDVVLYREAVRRGVSDYLVLPLTPLNIITALADLYHTKANHHLGRCVAFVPAKGGCGSSTLAQNIGWLAGEMLSKPVILVDADLAFGTAALNANLEPLSGLAEIVFAQERPDVNMIERSMCKISDMMSLLSSSSNLERALEIPPTTFDDVLDTLRAMASLIIVDLPHQWSGWMQHAIAACDDIIIVAEPDLASLRNTKILLDQASRMRTHDRKPAILLNKIGVPKRPEIQSNEFLNAFSETKNFTIQFDPNLFGTAANNGQMLKEVGTSAALEKTLIDLTNFTTGRSQAGTGPHRKGLSEVINRLVAFRR